MVFLTKVSLIEIIIVKSFYKSTKHFAIKLNATIMIFGIIKVLYSCRRKNLTFSPIIRFILDSYNINLIFNSQFDHYLISLSEGENFPSRKYYNG